MKTNPTEHKAKAVAHDKVTDPIRRRPRGAKGRPSRKAVLDGLEQINLQANGT